MSRADGTVLPNPAIPKTLGILNVIFAVVLSLFGVCGAVIFVGAPAFQRSVEARAAQQKAEEERQRAADLKVLDDRAAEAATDEARATIARERAELAGRMSAVPKPIDLSGFPSDPQSIGLILINVGWGLLLNVVLLISGVGMIRLRNWGRRFCMVWAVLTIATVLGWTLYSQVFNAEATRAAIEAQSARFRAAAQQPGATPADQATAQLFEVVQNYGVVFVLSNILAQLSYPILCLILINTARARAACSLETPRLASENTGGSTFPKTS